ncbi:MAG: arsenate reductase ArsC [Gemmatimonadota bacterium]|nr:MAG: arsenate reductase ArsC [Gemmatimonadota bacterium]
MTDSPQGYPTLIFLCVANSARSQMAEGLARSAAPAGWRIYSAGSEPSVVHPLAIEAMREIGIDISAQRSKGIDEVPLGEADVVITLCAAEVCPAVSGGAQRLHWPLPDPAAQGEMIRYQVEAFRETRDEIKRRLDTFWTERMH